MAFDVSFWVSSEVSPLGTTSNRDEISGLIWFSLGPFSYIFSAELSDLHNIDLRLGHVPWGQGYASAACQSNVI